MEWLRPTCSRIKFDRRCPTLKSIFKDWVFIFRKGEKHPTWLSGKWTLGGNGGDCGDSAELGKHPGKKLMVRLAISAGLWQKPNHSGENIVNRGQGARLNQWLQEDRI